MCVHDNHFCDTIMARILKNNTFDFKNVNKYGSKTVQNNKQVVKDKVLHTHKP